MPLLSEEQESIREMTRDFVRREVVPHAAEWDRTATVPLETVRRIGALGLFGVRVPTEWGGSGADFTAYVLATEALAYGDAGVCNMVSATNSFCEMVQEHGTPSQKERYLRPAASGQAIACLQITEPQAGSDAANLRTRAVRKGERFVLNGTKCLITAGGSSDFAVVFAVTDPEAGKQGISAFLLRTDQPGYRVSRVERKLGHRSNDTCEIVLEDLEVPVEDLLGPPGKGLRVALGGMDSGRIGVAAQSVGVAQAAFDAALGYARERETFGRRIFDHQAIAFKLADMATEIEAARRMALHAASLKDAGVRCVKESSMAKLFASAMCERVCSEAIQVHGGYGFVNDYPVEKFYRDARVFQIYEGTSEVQKILIARELAGDE